MAIQVFIAYSSPAGSTRKVAEVIKEGFSRRNVNVKSLDIARAESHHDFLKALETSGEGTCLFVGSPVYRDAAVRPVMSFIAGLPRMEGASAVPFVTWGRACSGVALWQMGSALKNKGLKLVGAAKVSAVHSLMWNTVNPAGKGHPDDTDLRAVEELTMALISRFNSGYVPEVSLDTLDYQPRVRSEQMKNKINTSPLIVPKNLKEELCSQCGVCREECPVGAVSLDPYPRLGPDCFDCFNCIRLCPENAIEPAISMQQIEDHIRERIRTIGERPYTQIFL